MLNLSKSDYEEPQCLLNMHPEVHRIPTDRVIEKLDRYLACNDYPAAERHLSYWLAEAKVGHDDHGQLTILNEQIGLYRKLSKEPEGLAAISSALTLAEAMGLSGTVTHGTTLVNAATGYKAFDRAAEALPLYTQAKEIYESHLPPTDGRLGGLYNNMALTFLALERYTEAHTLFENALTIMQAQKHGEAEMAITYLNLADLATAELGAEEAEEKVEIYLQKAEDLLNTESLPHDGAYAFVCEKCAPIFGYYGYFLTEQELTRRAKDIYKSNI